MKNTILFIAVILGFFLNSYSQQRVITKEVNPIEINAFLNKKGKSMLSAAKNKSYDNFRLNFAETEPMPEDPIRKVFNDLSAHIDSLPKEGKVNQTLPTRNKHQNLCAPALGYN